MQKREISTIQTSWRRQSEARREREPALKTLCGSNQSRERFKPSHRNEKPKRSGMTETNKPSNSTTRISRKRTMPLRGPWKNMGESNHMMPTSRLRISGSPLKLFQRVCSSVLEGPTVRDIRQSRITNHTLVAPGTPKTQLRITLDSQNSDSPRYIELTTRAPAPAAARPPSSAAPPAPPLVARAARPCPRAPRPLGPAAAAPAPALRRAARAAAPAWHAATRSGRGSPSRCPENERKDHRTS